MGDSIIAALLNGATLMEGSYTQDPGLSAEFRQHLYIFSYPMCIAYRSVFEYYQSFFFSST